ncbi:phage tail protein [Pectobacterium parvum]|uniref:phage tail protein n=1 Tax=Pectobacterium TaxID=122277 RepID=UPI0013FD25D3|nr:phage tail protein [Pectobacterium polaris]
MSQIESLTAFLSHNLPERVMHQFESALDNAELIPSPKALGLEQRRIGVFRYQAILNWGSFPYRICPPAQVYALVLAWLADSRNALYDELELSPPSVDIEFDEELSSPLEIVVELADSINIRPSETGDIPFGGKRWELADPELWTALSGALYAADASGAPLSEV